MANESLDPRLNSARDALDANDTARGLSDLRTALDGMVGPVDEPLRKQISGLYERIRKGVSEKALQQSPEEVARAQENLKALRESMVKRGVHYELTLFADSLADKGMAVIEQTRQNVEKLAKENPNAAIAAVAIPAAAGIGAIAYGIYTMAREDGSTAIGATLTTLGGVLMWAASKIMPRAWIEKIEEKTGLKFSPQPPAPNAPSGQPAAQPNPAQDAERKAKEVQRKAREEHGKLVPQTDAAVIRANADPSVVTKEALSKAIAAERSVLTTITAPDRELVVRLRYLETLERNEVSPTNILGTEAPFTLDGRVYRFKAEREGVLSVDGTRWKLQGKGFVNSFASFSISRANIRGRFVEATLTGTLGISVTKHPIFGEEHLRELIPKMLTQSDPIALDPKLTNDTALELKKIS